MQPARHTFQSKRQLTAPYIYNIAIDTPTTTSKKRIKPHTEQQYSHTHIRRSRPKCRIAICMPRMYPACGRYIWKNRQCVRVCGVVWICYGIIKCGQQTNMYRVLSLMKQKEGYCGGFDMCSKQTVSAIKLRFFNDT